MPDTGRPVRVWGVVRGRLEGGKIKDPQILMDALGLMKPLGADPDSGHDPEARIHEIMTDLYPALICPAEMWWQVLEALGPPERVRETLESLSAESQARIRDYYRVMRPTYFSDYLAREDRDERRALLCTRFIAWCESSNRTVA